MLKSCKYCGRVHEASYKCPPKAAAEADRQNRRGDTAARAFRKSARWTNKSRQVRERDHWMCLCCKAKLYISVEADSIDSIKDINTHDLSVHHIVPIEEEYNLRLDETNLITVCAMHHELCEAGTITREEQKKLVRESMNRRDGKDEDYTAIVI